MFCYVSIVSALGIKHVSRDIILGIYCYPHLSYSICFDTLLRHTDLVNLELFHSSFVPRMRSEGAKERREESHMPQLSNSRKNEHLR